MVLERETAVRSNKSSSTRSSSRHKRSGYEPSDTETDWQESPWHGDLLIANRSKTPDPVRTINPISNWSEIPDSARIVSEFSRRSKTPDPDRTISSRRHISKGENDVSADKASRSNPVTRRHSRSPYKPNRHVEYDVSSIANSGLRRNTSPLKFQEHSSKHVSPYSSRREEVVHEFHGSSQKHNQRTTSKHQELVDRGDHLQPQVSRVSEGSHGPSIMSNYSRNRSVSAPRPRPREKEQPVSSGGSAPGTEGGPLPLAKATIHEESDGSCAKSGTPYEPNERIANILSKHPSANSLMQSTESISLGDIFISRNGTDPQKEFAVKNSDKNKFTDNLKILPQKNNVIHEVNRGRVSSNQNTHAVTVSTMFSQTNTTSYSFFPRASNGKSSSYSGKLSDSSGLNGSFKRFAASRQTETWFSCVKGRSCTKSKSPDSRAIDEASFIERALVVEELRPFWADKHMPCSLSQFICHKQQAQLLKKLISHNNCPHILLKGPSGSGKKSLSMALLHELFGDSWKISHDVRHFHVQEGRPIQVAVPLTLSPHHVELNLKTESKNARNALMALVKEITDDRAHVSEVSDVSFRADYKVIILYDVDKVADNVQHLIRWIMDRYTDACKIILCCEDDAYILDSVKTRCEFIAVEAPVTHEIMEVLIQIAKRENFELSVSFAARIATKSKQNLRKAVMALEACKAHNYPFVDEQPIPLGWEEVVGEVAAEILADPSSKRLFSVRGKFQKLLVEFVHPKLILQKLVEQFLKRVEAGLKRELYYWHAYYDKRLPVGTSALLKLEEFVAKFMSIYRRAAHHEADEHRSRFV